MTTPTSEDVLLILRAFLKGDKGDQGEDGLMGGGSGSFIPGSRLTLVSGQPEMPQDVDISSTTLWLAPFNGSQDMLFNGTTWASYPVTSGPYDQVGLSMSGGSKWTPNTKRDVWEFPLDGEAAIGTGPAWPGDSFSARNITFRDGIKVNAASIVLDLDGGGQVTVPANQARYRGSINPASTGTLTATFAFGQNRRCDVWNADNRREIALKVVQPPVSGAVVSWMPDTQYPTIKAFNNSLSNSGIYFTGAPTVVDIAYAQRGFVNSHGYGITGVFWMVCKDLITNPVGLWGGASSDATNDMFGFPPTAAIFTDPTAIGAHTAIMGTTKASATGCTLWGQHSAPYGASAQTMWIKYLG